MNAVKMQLIMDELIIFLQHERMNKKYNYFLYNFLNKQNYKTTSVQRFDNFIDYINSHISLINFDSEETAYDIMLDILYNLKFTNIHKEKLYLLKDKFAEEYLLQNTFEEDICNAIKLLKM